MLDIATTFLVQGLNDYLHSRTAQGLGEAELCRFVDDTGKWTIKEDRLGACVINIEEDRLFKGQLPESVRVDGHLVLSEPALRVSLYLLVAANFTVYSEALRHLSWVLMYFQLHPTFTQAGYPALDARVERLSVDLHSLSFDQITQIWSFIGGKHLPSVLYKVRVVLLHDPQPRAVVPPVVNTEIGATPL
jgi:hypothetical protein